MKPAARLLSACLLAGLSFACHSTSSAADVPCICGTPEADLQGCPHRTCLAGQRNPDNAACVCGGLTLPR